MAGAPLADDVAGELARNGVGAEDAGIDVKQFHDEVLCSGEAAQRDHGLSMRMVCFIDKMANLR
jgi:hypothetical protein